MTGAAEAQPAPLRVLTWNVQHANAVRTREQAVWLATADPHDVLVLTEVAAGDTGRLLARSLRELGYTAHLPEAGNDRYRVLLACRTGGLRVSLDTGVGVLPHRCVAARVEPPGTEIGVIGLYVPSRGPKERRNVARRAFQHAVATALPGMVARLGVAGPVVVAGDLNVVEPDHDPRHPVFDHTFITAAHAGAVRDCGYLQAVRENGLSDHAAMTSTIAIQCVTAPVPGWPVPWS